MTRQQNQNMQDMLVAFVLIATIVAVICTGFSIGVSRNVVSHKPDITYQSCESIATTGFLDYVSHTKCVDANMVLVPVSGGVK